MKPTENYEQLLARFTKRMTQVESQFPTKNLEESEKYFLKIIEKNKNDENALLNLAILNDRRKNFEKSIEINKKIIEINPNNINANNNLGVLNHNNLKYDEAINYFKNE